MSVALMFEAPPALLALAGLPLLAWLFRSRPRPPVRETPSLLFLTEAPGPMLARERRALETELWMALAALALLALAAAGPALGARTPEREVRVVVSQGAAGRQAGYAARVAAALERIQSVLGPGDRLVRADVPAEGAAAGLPRPRAEALLAAARAGEPAVAYVLSDRLPQAADVSGVGLGDASVSNAGLVAVDWERAGRGRLHVVVAHDGPRAARSTLVAEALLAGGAVEERSRRALELAPDGALAVLLEGVGTEGALVVRLEHARASEAGAVGDALDADDRVVLRAEPLVVEIAPALPEAHRAALRAALAAALGDGGFVLGSLGPAGGLRVGALGGSGPAPREGVIDLSLAALGASGGGTPVPPGAEASDGSAWVVDVTLEDQPLVCAPAPAGVRWHLMRGGVGLVGTDGEGGLVVAFDLSRGAPAPALHPAWPILVDNVVRRGAGSVGGGVRVEGLLDPATSRPGRDASPFDAGRLAAARATEVPARVRLAPLLALAALLLSGGLWWREARRRRATG